MDELDKRFNEEWGTYFKEWEMNFEKRHKSKFLRYFSKPDYFHKDSLHYKLLKTIAELFFKKGCIVAKEEMIKRMDNKLKKLKCAAKSI